MRWFISDLHFFHNLCHRKYRSNNKTIDEMNYEIINKWNKQVKTRDIVYVIGDVTFGKYQETKDLISKMNGRKILIRGNHDERFTSKEWIELGFEDVRDTMVIKKEKTKYILSHFPYSSPLRFYWYKFFSKRSEAGYYKLYLPYKGYRLIHGHHHSGPMVKYNQFNVAWDIHKQLINENEIHERLNNQKKNLFKEILNIFW